MPENKEIFNVVNTAVNNALHKYTGSDSGLITLPDGTQVNRGMSQVAVALMQLSLRYFAQTKAPKAVVWTFFLDIMGIEGEKATLEERNGKLFIIPPKQRLVVVQNITKAGGENGSHD